METETWPFTYTWSLHENKEILSRYQILEKIGEGAFADVYRARRREDNLIVALKEVHNPESSFREVKALLLLDHPNVVKLYEYFMQGSDMVLVLEYLPSNLSQVIRAGNLTEAEVKGWCIQILRGLSACHSASVLHRDVKPANLLIAKDGTLKIADFGTARVLIKDAEAEIDGYGYGSEVANDEVAASGLDNSEPCESGREFNPQIEVDGVTSTGTGVSHVPFRTEAPGRQLGSTSPNRFETGNAGVQYGSGFDDPQLASTSPRDRDSDLPNRESSGSAAEGRTHEEVEKMERNVSQSVGRSVSGFQSPGLHVQDPGCCGWFSSETNSALPSIKTADPAALHSNVVWNAETDHRPGQDENARSHEDDDEESDSDSDSRSREKQGFQDWIVTQENTQQTYDADNLAHVEAEGEGDLLRKFHRFLRKRTGRLNSEEKLEPKEVSASEPEGSAMADDQEDVWKEPSRNWDPACALMTHSEQAPSLTTSVFRHPAAQELRRGVDELDPGGTFKDARANKAVRSNMSSSGGPLRAMASAHNSAHHDGFNRVMFAAGLSAVHDEVASVEEKSENELEPDGFCARSVGAGNASSSHKKASRSGAINIDGKGGQRPGTGPEGECGSGGKIVGTSWDQVDEHLRSLSDVEGTRWFGAPDFQDSYMETGKADAFGGMRSSGETRRADIEFEEEWEDGTEGRAYRRRGGSSQDTSDRGENTSEDDDPFTTMVGTRWYRAPELLYGATKYGMEIDIWAFGCICGELLSGKPLFPGLNDIDQLSRLVRILGSPTEKEWGGVTLLPDFSKIKFVDDRSPMTLRNYLPNISKTSLQFLERVLAYDPLRRPTAAEGVEDDYFHTDPLPIPRSKLTFPTAEEKDYSTDDDEWGDPGSPFSDFEMLG
ncbi:hypothetical protein Mapa_009382 [Marchantia paleacea]|nr:hypothetical protein Mapa_009382 [Marchantia paleacea]